MGGIFGGGKTKSKTEVEYPQWLEDMQRANAGLTGYIGSLGPMMSQLPTVAAQSPYQTAAMGNTNQLAQAFGMGYADPTAGLPQAGTYAGGMQGYSPYGAIYDAVHALPDQQLQGYSGIFGPQGKLAWHSQQVLEPDAAAALWGNQGGSWYDQLYQQLYDSLGGGRTGTIGSAWSSNREDGGGSRADTSSWGGGGFGDVNDRGGSFDSGFGGLY